MPADVDGGGISAVAWGVLAVVLGGGAVATWLTALSPGSGFPAWPGWTLSALTVCAIYMCFASLFGKWPTDRGLSRGDRRASVAERTGNAGQSISGSPGSIQAGPGGNVKTGDVFIVNALVSPSQNEVAEPKPEPLQPRHDQSSIYRHTMQSQPGITEHRVGVFNPNEKPAPRVRIYLVRMDPRPRNILPGYEPVIPYALPLQSNGDHSIGLTIDPRQQQYWIIGFTGTGSDGNMNAGGFAPPDQRWRGLPWRFDPDEQWRLFYQIVCDGRPDVDFSIVVSALDSLPRCDLEG